MYRKILIGGATAAVILGSGGAALALSGSDSSGTTNGSPSSTPSGSNSNGHAAGSHSGHGQHGGKGKGKRLLRRAAHGAVVIKTKKGFVTVDFAKGAVSSVSSSSISVHTKDNKTETFAVNKDTKVRARHKGSKPTSSSIGKVSKGDRVIVFGTGTSTVTAKRIGDAGPQPGH